MGFIYKGIFYRANLGAKGRFKEKSNIWWTTQTSVQANSSFAPTELHLDSFYFGKVTFRFFLFW